MERINEALLISERYENLVSLRSSGILTVRDKPERKIKRARL
jgi:hypothetical protein